MWVAGNGLLHYLPVHHPFQQNAAYLIYLGAGLLNPPFLYLTWALQKPAGQKLAWWKPLFALVSTIAFVIIVVWAGLIMGTEINARTAYKEVLLDPTVNIIYNMLLLGILGWIIANLWHMLKHGTGTLRAQTLYILTGTAIIVVPGIFFNMLLPIFGDFRYTWVGTGSTIIWLGFISYAIVTQQLFDIRLVIKRTLVYSGVLLFTLAVYSMVIFFFTALFGGDASFTPKIFTANLIAAVLIAVGFGPIQKYLTRTTDKYLFKGEYNAQTVLAELSEQLSNSVDIRQATQSLVTLVKKNMRLTHTAVIIFNEENSQIIVKETIQDGYPDPSLLLLRPDNLLLQEVARNPEILISSELKRVCDVSGTEPSHVQICQILLTDLTKLQIAVTIPILLKGQAIGVFLVGEKLSGDLFSANDIEFLTIVATQTTNAIQKARFWEEDQLKSEFVSIASHELLTPTAAIKGYLSMILDDNMGEVDDKARAMLTKVFGSADRLAHLVEDLLNVSRIEGGRLKINKRVFSLVEQTQKAVDELQVNAKAKSLDLAFVADQHQLPPVYADADQIYRVLINLIGNAVKYTPQGWVRCYVTQPNATHLMFTVVDSGLGIPAEQQPHLFEKFFRADRREIYGIQGTGLGLYISKKVVELMGGEISLASTEGKGTTFYVTVPVATGNEPTTEAPQAVSLQAPAASLPASAAPASPPPPDSGAA